MSESKLQGDCFQWFHNTYPEHRGKLWAVPNGGRRNLIEAVRLKSTGVVKGVHDLLMLHDGQFYTFELKFGRNKLTKEQIEWQDVIQSAGGICFEIRDFDTFKKIIVNILNS